MRLIIPERSAGYKSVPIKLLILFLRVCMVAKSAGLAHFQPAISPGWCKPWLPNTLQAQRMPSATQAWATRACSMACVCEVPPKV